MQRTRVVAAVLVSAVVSAVLLGGAVSASASEESPRNRGWEVGNRGWDHEERASHDQADR